MSGDAAAKAATDPPLTRDSVIEAHRLIKPYIHRTPVLTNRTLTSLASTPRSPAELEGTPWAGRTPAAPTIRLWFKCENLQRVGAFKVRGAFHAIERLKMEPGWEEGGGRARGVVTHSSGNHAQALSLAARANGMPAHIVMPTISPPPKIAATRGYGARIIFSGSTSVEREAATEKVVAETGARLIPPYDHPHIVLGQGTIGLEMQEQVEALLAAAAEEGGEASGGGGGGGGGNQLLADAWSGSAERAASRAGCEQTEQEEEGKEEGKKKKGKGLDAIVTPCGGGGMLAGVALSCEGTGTAVFGAEPTFEGADDCARGLAAGARVGRVASLTVADGLRTPVGRVPWSVIHDRRLVRAVYGVAEAHILAAMRLVLERLKLVVEPSACVGLAVALFHEDFRARVEREAGPAGWDLGVVLSGGNVSLEALGTLFQG